MDTQTNSQNTEPQKNTEFVQKKVETPLLDQTLRQRLAPDVPVSPAAPAGGFTQFYKSNKFYFWAIGAGLAVIAALSFFAFRKGPAAKPVEAKVNIDISAPDTVASGASVVYKITLDNQDTTKLTNAELDVTYPDGFSFLSSSPPASNLSGTQFAVPDIIPGQKPSIFIKVKASGNINDSKQLTAVLHYNYSNFSSEFSKSQTYTVRLAASNVAMELSGPQTTNNAQLIVYTLTYKNNSDSDMQNARITLTYPEGFQFASSDPQPDIGNNVWNIATLPKGKDGSISIQGNYSGSSPGQGKTIAAALSVLGANGQYFDQASTSFSTAISSLPLLITQQLAGSAASNGQIANPGDMLTYSIKYQNNASTAAHGVNIVATLDSDAINPASIQAEGAQISNNTITWNAASVSRLELLSPSESGTLTFSVAVNNPAVKDSAKNLTVVSSVKIKSSEYDTYFPGNDLTVKIASPGSITGSVGYVSGALPPQVGKDTVYRVTILMKNATNDYSNSLVTAFIPLGAGGFDQSSVNAQESSRVTYDPSTGKITWDAGTVTAHAGQFSPARQLSFTVRLNPSAGQVGHSPTLVKNILLSATDSFTGQAINLNTDDLTTDDASQGYGNGSVRQ